MHTDVIIHLENDLPIMVDLEALPEPTDRLIRCTNVRTVDGKRPSFVNDRRATFLIPVDVIRLIEVPPEGDPVDGTAAEESVPEPAMTLEPTPDEEPDEDLLARIREI